VKFHLKLNKKIKECSFAIFCEICGSHSSDKEDSNPQQIF
jgi:hypothetical protein